MLWGLVVPPPPPSTHTRPYPTPYLIHPHPHLAPMQAADLVQHVQQHVAVLVPVASAMVVQHVAWLRPVAEATESEALQRQASPRGPSMRLLHAVLHASGAVSKARRRVAGDMAGQEGAVAAATPCPRAPLLPTGPGLVLDELAPWARGWGDGNVDGAATWPRAAACGNPLCTGGGACGGPGQAPTPRRLLVCGGCRSVAYCSRACAQAMWPRAHRFSCARLAARRAAGAGGPLGGAAAEQQGQQLGGGAGVAEPAPCVDG